MAINYRMLQHPETRRTHRDYVIGVGLVSGFDIVRKWFFANHKYGTEFSHKFRGYTFTFRVVRDRYIPRDTISGKGSKIVKCFSITATAKRRVDGTMQVVPVNVPEWFIYLHPGNE